MSTVDYDEDYEWLRLTTSNCKGLRVTSDYKWLRVTTGQTMIKMLQLWVKIIFTSEKVIQSVSFCMISDIWIVKQLSVQLLHYVRLNGYGLCRFQKKLLHATFSEVVVLKKKIRTALLIYLLNFSKVSIVPLKKRTLKQLLRFYCAGIINFGQVNVKLESEDNRSCSHSKISQSINVEWRTCNRNGKQFF